MFNPERLNHAEINPAAFLRACEVLQSAEKAYILDRYDDLPGLLDTMESNILNENPTPFGLIELKQFNTPGELSLLDIQFSFNETVSQLFGEIHDYTLNKVEGVSLLLQKKVFHKGSPQTYDIIELGAYYRRNKKTIGTLKRNQTSGQDLEVSPLDIDVLRSFLRRIVQRLDDESN